MTVTWFAVGRLLEGIVRYELRDCTTGRVKARDSRSLQYPRGSRGTSDADRVTLTVRGTHRYALRVSGGGSYERLGAGTGGVGYFSPHPPPGVAPFTTESVCR
jgi:hypothetical protein